MKSSRQKAQAAPDEVDPTEIPPSGNESRSPTGGQSSPSEGLDINRNAIFITDNTSPEGARRGGPRTERGKERSSKNSLKHGIFAKVVLLRSERTGQFHALLQGFRDYFQPVGMPEEILIETLAISKWRSRRALNAEKAEIEREKSLNSRTIERKKREMEEAANLINSSATLQFGMLHRLRNPLVIKTCIEILESFQLQVMARGFDPVKDYQALAKVYGAVALKDIFMIYELCNDPGPLAQEESFKEFDLPAEERRKKFADYLQGEIDRYRQLEGIFALLSDEDATMETESASVPEPQRLDRLLRYTASLDREFDRTLSQLERLQRIRKGQPVPPPLNVNVST